MTFRKLFFLAIVLIASLAAAIERDNLSPTAQKLVPDDRIKEIHLKNGDIVKGSIISETDESVMIKLEKGTISYDREFPRSQIDEIKSLDIASHFASALSKLNLSNQKSYDARRYKQAIALFEEFLAKCPEHKAVPEIRKKMTAFQEELAKVENGLSKIDGQWYAPVAAAIKNFDKLTKTIRNAEQKLPGIESDRYRDNPKAKEKYEQLKVMRRDIARELPSILSERIPRSIEKQRLDEAAAEVTAFLHFFISRVMQAESRGKSNIQEFFADIDFGYITRLQHQIVEAYAEAAEENQDIPAVDEEDMVYIPGGLFLMGDEEAEPGEDTFPMHIVKLDPFLIDKYEVTNAEYREFYDYVTSTGDSSMEHPDAPPMKDHKPTGWESGHLKQPDKPVVGVDWFDAYAYAKWRGKRLPTEAEWEYVARSDDGRKYPWGDNEDARRFINTEDGRQRLAAEIDVLHPKARPEQSLVDKWKGKPPPAPPKTTLPETTWPADRPIAEKAEMADFQSEVVDTSPFGLLHIPANAAEWVHDFYDPNYYARSPVANPQGPETGEKHVYRGDAYLNRREGGLETYQRQAAEGRGEDRGKPFIGFRCAKSLE